MTRSNALCPKPVPIQESGQSGESNGDWSWLHHIANRDSGRRYRIRLSDTENPDRPRIALGRMSKRQAESVKIHVEHLIACKKAGTAIPLPTQAWLEQIPESVRKRLETLELVVPRERGDDYTVATWTDAYMEKRTDIKPNTRRNMAQARSFLLEFAGADLALGSYLCHR